MHQSRTVPSSVALRFVLIIGIANLFADMTYEGARSVTGAFLASLGASATVVGFTAGFGELRPADVGVLAPLLALMVLIGVSPAFFPAAVDATVKALPVLLR